MVQRDVVLPILALAGEDICKNVVAAVADQAGVNQVGVTGHIVCAGVPKKAVHVVSQNVGVLEAIGALCLQCQGRSRGERRPSRALKACTCTMDKHA